MLLTIRFYLSCGAITSMEIDSLESDYNTILARICAIDGVCTSLDVELYD